jgi:hypothetical protein
VVKRKAKLPLEQVPQQKRSHVGEPNRPGHAAYAEVWGSRRQRQSWSVCFPQFFLTPASLTVSSWTSEVLHFCQDKGCLQVGPAR